MIALFGTFFFMSVMFPTIFALGIRGLGDYTKLGASLIVMSIVGGAIAPPFMGHIADVHSLRLGYAGAARMLCIHRVYTARSGRNWKRATPRPDSFSLTGNQNGVGVLHGVAGADEADGVRHALLEFHVRLERRRHAFQRGGEFPADGGRDCVFKNSSA